MPDIPREMCGQHVQFDATLRKALVYVRARDYNAYMPLEWMKRYPDAWTPFWSFARVEYAYRPEHVRPTPLNPLNPALYDDVVDATSRRRFLNMVSRIATFNHDAARYLLTASNCYLGDTLSAAFAWSATPQGTGYWEEIWELHYRYLMNDDPPPTIPVQPVHDYVDLCLLVSRFRDPNAFHAMVMEAPNLDSFMCLDYVEYKYDMYNIFAWAELRPGTNYWMAVANWADDIRQEYQI